MGIAYDYFVVIAFGICVFIIAYLYSDKVVGFFYQKSFGNRQEIIDLMDKMLLDVDREKLTMTLLLLSLGLGFVFFLAFWPNIIAGILFGVIITILGWSIPKLILQNIWEKRCSKITNQMVDGLTIMANGIKAGLSITQSMERVIANMNGPLPREFGLVLNKVRLGMSVEDALNEFGNRIPKQDVQMFVTTVNILKETGGNLAETFETIVSTVRERQKIEKKIEAMTAQGVWQGIIITLVPFLLLIIFLIIDPNYVMPLFTTPIGWVALLLMLTLQIIGGVMMKKIVTIKV